MLISLISINITVSRLTTRDLRFIKTQYEESREIHFFINPLIANTIHKKSFHSALRRFGHNRELL
jgi:hypothetical protein